MHVLYFTCVNVGTTSNGGALVCREHARRIASVPGVNLVLCMAGPQEHEAAGMAFAQSIGAFPVFLTWRSDALTHQPVTKWPFLLEATAASHPEIDAGLCRILADQPPDLLVVDYLLSVLFIRRAFRMANRRLTITLNRERRLFGDLRRAGLVPPDASSTFVSEMRLAAFEQWVHLNSNAVVALSPGDLPLPRPGLRRSVLAPLFPAREQRWSPSGQGRVLFVGNIGHYPNRLAIEWIATQLAPVLALHCDQSRLRILGASSEAVPEAWRAPNIDYLGVGGAEDAQREYCTTDLFVAPIANTFGTKIKLLDCLAYGTPFVATKAALTGLPFVDDVPLIDLSRPDMAADIIADQLMHPAGLRKFSARASNLLAQRLVACRDDWAEVLRSAAGI